MSCIVILSKSILQYTYQNATSLMQTNTVCYYCNFSWRLRCFLIVNGTFKCSAKTTLFDFTAVWTPLEQGPCTCCRRRFAVTRHRMICSSMYMTLTYDILLIKSDLKWCMHLSRSLFLYFNYLVSVTAGGPVSPRGNM